MSLLPEFGVDIRHDQEVGAPAANSGIALRVVRFPGGEIELALRLVVAASGLGTEETFAPGSRPHADVIVLQSLGKMVNLLFVAARTGSR